MKNKKKIIMIIAISLVVLLGLSYALFDFLAEGSTNEQLVTGDIYMHYLESNTLTITDAFPRNAYDPTKYIEFTIDGKNTTTNHDVIYDILVERGAVPTGKLEANRIADTFVKFRLVSVSNNVETEIFDNRSYNDFSNGKRIHVATIPKNTTSEITHRYRLYMWIDQAVTIGDANQDYTFAEWNNVFASVKVNVTGDFEQKFVTLSDVISNVMNNGGSSYIKSYNATKGNASYDTQDTVGTNSSKLDVLYYTGSEALAHGNVLFAGYCWQIIRTTDTGGLRIIYNGPAENNQCLTTRNSGGTLKGVIAKDSYINYDTERTDISSITNFGTGYDYNLGAGTFTLTGTSELAGKTWANNSSELIGTYACSDNTTTCTELWYIGHYQTAKKASVGKYIIGTIPHYSGIGTSYYSASGSPALVGYMYNKVCTQSYKTVSKAEDYANSVTWNGTSYVLDSSTTTNLTNPDATHHYVCDTTCNKVRFYYLKKNSAYYYVLLENGDIDPLYVMINKKMQGEIIDANINRYSSAIKGQIDNWYKKNINTLNLSVKGLIDTKTVYCNDRTTTDIQGWNKDTSIEIANSTISFYQNTNNKDLRCTNLTDRFSVGNETANLIYPVGLITEPERNLMGFNYAATGHSYYSSSPARFYYNDVKVRYVDQNGSSSDVSQTNYWMSLRPVVTIRSDADIEEGDGSYETPYVIGEKITR